MNIWNYFKALSDFLDSRFSTYKKVFILGDFNVEVDEQNMKIFYDSYSLTSLIKQRTCYCLKIHLIPHVLLRRFQTKYVIETELSDFNSREKRLKNHNLELWIIGLTNTYRMKFG